jgi:hypothetical protein
MTGLDISIFHGANEASQSRPFLVDRVQLDARLRCDYPQPTPPSQLPDLRFQISFLGSSIFMQNYSLTGAIPSSRLLPASVAVPDNPRQSFYSMPSGEFIRINSQGDVETLPIPSDLPELSWPMGFAWNSKRERALLVSLGGEGYLYAYTPESQSWSVVSSMQNLLFITRRTISFTASRCTVRITVPRRSTASMRRMAVSPGGLRCRCCRSMSE